VDHVESAGVSDSPQVGDVFHVRAYVFLGDLAPDQVEVQLVHGRASESDELTDIEVKSLILADSYEGSQYCFEGDLVPKMTGPFGHGPDPAHPPGHGQRR
jgi:starch phosphorylase